MADQCESTPRAVDSNAFVRRALGRWYDRARRDLPWRRTDDPYAIWVSEVMLQQTQVNTVVPYYHRFLERFPDVDRLAGARLQSVYKLWEGLGYYARARHLHRAARVVREEMGGRVPCDPRVLRRLPGIGNYIAAAILSIAFGRPFAVVDGNVKRVLARLFLVDAPVNQGAAHGVFQELATLLLDRRDPGRHNQAMMELGALVCVPRRPLCDQCPLADACKAFQGGVTGQYPLRLQRRALARQHWVAGVVVKNGRLLLTRRPAQGLLAGLWEFPCGRLLPGGDPADACVDMIRSCSGLETGRQQYVTTVHHAYTHFKLRMEVYLCRWRHGRVRLNGPAAFRWLRLGETGRLPLHGAVHKALPALEKLLGRSRLDCAGDMG
jgi:A/G-specific adenine glycosylase